MHGQIDVAVDLLQHASSGETLSGDGGNNVQQPDMVVLHIKSAGQVICRHFPHFGFALQMFQILM